VAKNTNMKVNSSYRVFKFEFVVGTILRACKILRKCMSFSIIVPTAIHVNKLELKHSIL